MAADIGVKLSMEGEKQFKESLKDITQESKTLKSEMEKVRSGFNDNTSAMDKYKAQSEVLAQQIDNQKERVALLTDQYNKLADEYGESDRRTQAMADQVNKATTALNKMKSELDGLGGPLKAIGDDMQAAGDKISKAGDKIQGIGKGVTKTVTGPIAAVGAASMAAWKEYDDATDSIIKATGATGDTLDGLVDTMNNLATSIPVTFEQASTAVGEINTRFGSTGEELEEISSAFLKFGELNGISDLSGTIDTVQSSMAAWGIATEDTGAVLDTLNKVAQDTGENAVSVADILQTNATTFKDMGYSYSDAATLIGNLGKEGIDATAVVTGLNKAFLQGAEDGKSAKEVISELTDTMTNATSDSDAYAAAIELFGKKAGPQLAGALQEGRISLDDLGTSINDNLGSVSETFDATIDPVDSLQTSFNELKIVGADVGSILMEMAVPALQSLSDIVKDLKTAWDGLSPGMQDAIVKGAAIAAVVGPLIMVVGGIVSGIGSIISAGGALVAWIGSLLPAAGAATAAGGAAAAAGAGVGAALLPIIAIIGAVVAAGALIIANWDTIKETALALKETIATKWEEIKTTTSEAMENVKTKMSEAFLAVKEDVTTKWEEMKTTTGEALEAFKTKIDENGGGWKGAMTTAFGLINDAVTEGWAEADEITGGKLGDIKDLVSKTFNGLVSSALDWGRDMLDNFKKGIEEKWEGLKSFIGEVGQGIKDFLGFSVPKKGPLSDADTWMPDMMQLLSQGIRDNEYLVKQAAEDAAYSMYLPNNANDVQMSTVRELGRLNDSIESGSTNVTVMLTGDAGKMLKVLSVENSSRTRATGYNTLSGVMA